MDAPRTPPRQQRSHVPVTPRTPRFGSFEDHQDPPIKPKHSKKQQTLTPRLTPHRNRKRNFQDLNHNKLFDVYRDDSSSFKELKPAKIHLNKSTITPQIRDPESQPRKDSFAHFNEEDSYLDEDEDHPHRSKPPKVPGMWFSFRGRKIFRPYPPGEEPIKPVRLFSTNDSEDETDKDSN